MIVYFIALHNTDGIPTIRRPSSLFVCNVNVLHTSARHFLFFVIEFKKTKQQLELMLCLYYCTWINHQKHFLNFSFLVFVCSLSLLYYFIFKYKKLKWERFRQLDSFLKNQYSSDTQYHGQRRGSIWQLT